MRRRSTSRSKKRKKKRKTRRKVGRSSVCARERRGPTPYPSPSFPALLAREPHGISAISRFHETSGLRPSIFHQETSRSPLSPELTNHLARICPRKKKEKKNRKINASVPIISAAGKGSMSLTNYAFPRMRASGNVSSAPSNSVVFRCVESNVLVDQIDRGCCPQEQGSWN